MYIIFSDKIQEYQSFTDSIITTTAYCVRDPILMGKFYDSNPTGSTVFFIMMIFLFVFIAQNIFITLVLR